MMIDPKGKPYEITVIDSSGNPVLDKAAVRAVDQMSFIPARRGNTPIDSSLSVKMLFYTGHAIHGAKSKFVTAYGKFAKDIDAGDKVQAESELADLEVTSLYEDAFRAYAQYLYDRKWGSEEDQLADLRRAVANDDLGPYLPSGLHQQVLKERLALEVKLGDYGAALVTWKALDRIAPDATRGELQPTIDRINALRNSDQTVITSGSMSHRGTWSGHLFRNRFSVSVKSGGVSEIKLRCKQKYALFKYDPKLQYSVDTSAGECSIEVIGDPGTTFELSQLVTPAS